MQKRGMAEGHLKSQCVPTETAKINLEGNICDGTDPAASYYSLANDYPGLAKLHQYMQLKTKGLRHSLMQFTVPQDRCAGQARMVFIR